MNQNKLETISNLFEGKEIRSVWDSEKEEYYFSVVDVIGVLTDNDYQKSRNYWKWLKSKLNEEGSKLVSKTNQLKMKLKKDGKNYLTDTLDTEGIFRLIESVPSTKAELKYASDYLTTLKRRLTKEEKSELPTKYRRLQMILGSHMKKPIINQQFQKIIL